MITVTFETFDEVVDFAKKVLGDVSQKTEISKEEPVQMPQPGVQSPVQPPVQQPMPQPVQQPEVPPVSAASAIQQTCMPLVSPGVQTSQTSYTLDDLARAAMTLMDSGKQGELLGLLGSFGVEALPALPPAQYGAFAVKLREMGAQI